MASGIGIVGYGTAGQALALQLARVVQSVTVYERVSEPGPVRAERGTLRDAAGREHGPHALLILADGAASRLRAAQDTRRDRPYRWGAVWGLLPTPAGWPLDRLEQRYSDTRRMAGLLPVGRLPGEAPDVYRLCFYWSAPAAELDGLCAAGVDAVMPDLPAAVASGRGCAEVPRGYDRTARRAHVAAYQWLSRRLTPWFQSDWHWLGPLRDVCALPVARQPGVAGLAARVLSGRYAWRE